MTRGDTSPKAQHRLFEYRRGAQSTEWRKYQWSYWNGLQMMNTQSFWFESSGDSICYREFSGSMHLFSIYNCFAERLPAFLINVTWLHLFNTYLQSLF